MHFEEKLKMFITPENPDPTSEQKKKSDRVGIAQKHWLLTMGYRNSEMNFHCIAH